MVAGSISERHIIDLIKQDNFYINFKLFAKPDGFALVGIFIPPTTLMANVDDAHIRCSVSEKRLGCIVGPEDPLYSKIAPHFPKEMRAVVASLSDATPFINYITDTKEPVPIPDRDVSFSLSLNNDLTPEPHRDYFLLNSKSFPLPSRDHIIRVAGPIGYTGFVFSGGSWFGKMCSVVEHHLGQPLSSIQNILDWGCGCGRILRHLRHAGINNVHGADIDRFNVDWVNATFGAGSASVIHFDPPMPFQDNSFDLIYGHSVFTHLSIPDHRAWRDELHRILKPGGVALITFCTEYGTYVHRFMDFESNPTFLNAYIKDGFFDFGSQNVGVDDDRKGYYRLISHTTPFIIEEWQQLFDIRRIYRGFAEHQDLFVFKKQDQ